MNNNKKEFSEHSLLGDGALLQEHRFISLDEELFIDSEPQDDEMVDEEGDDVSIPDTHRAD